VIPDEPDTPQYLSRKRRHYSGESDEGSLSRSVDQREKAEMALRHLRDYLGEIFEAEDQMQPGAVHSSTLFTAAGEGISLSLLAQTKVETLIQKVIAVRRFAQVPLDDLLRLQKLSEYALKDTENVEVKVEESMGEAEVEAWLPQLGIAELGIKAARTSLRIMSGGREDKQLYSEDLIQSALNAFKNVTETCIIPVVEMRSTGSTASLFKLLSAEKKTITNLLAQCRRLFAQMATLVASIELSETVVNTLEFTASQLIFVENAHSEKESVLGVTKFDSLRVVAMDVLAQIFLCNPAQRQGIFDDILTSLEKLPVTKQSARQFKLAEGGSIQLVSALIMRLIQTSAGKSDEGKESRRRKALEAINGDEEMNDGAQGPTAGKTTVNSEARGEQQPVTAIQELREAFSPLVDTAKANAFYVTNFIVARAMKSTKSGDAPYRNLLDLFVEDFIACLNSTDWPAAEMLLRLLLFKMVQLAEGEKTPAPAKNMALDLLGLMGAAISELRSNIRKTAGSLENGDSDLARYLCRLAEASLEKHSSDADIVSWACGPYRTCLEFLEDRASADGDPQLASAIGFFTAEWASKISSTFDLISDDDHDHIKVEKEYGRLAYRVRMMINDRRWLSTEYSFDPVSPPHARLAYSLTLLHSAFCGSFGRVMTILLGSMASDQATVRSKSLKSVNQVLDTDATILDTDRTVMLLINRCANDSSVSVRDAALGLIGKCIVLRPALEEEMIASILQRVNDSGVGVRKRAIKLSKDIYLRNMNREVRSQIADSLLHRVTDLDEGVQDLARQTIEEVWMSPFYQSTSSENLSTQFKLAMADHVALMVKTVQRSSGVATVLDKVLQHLLSTEAKSKANNQKVCKALVATMFETIIDNPAGEGDDAPSARDALQILTIFARSNPHLFTADQIQLLEPYIRNVGVGDDMAIYRSVVVIFRHVLPVLAKVHHAFLVDVRKELMPAVSRVGKTILDDVIACVWIISEVLGDIQHLTRLVLSSLSGILKMKNAILGENDVKKLVKLLPITGMCGKHCNLDPQIDAFRQAFPASFSPKKEMDVSRLMVDTFAPFASSSQPAEIRKAALDAIGMVCQSWPKNFSFANIYTTFINVFEEQDPILESIIMRAFKDFLTLEEKRSEAGKDGAPNVAAESAAKLGVMGGGQGDGVALGIAQRFLHHIVRVALLHKDDQGLLATEVVASIARQGLVHPKETGSSLIALETSSNAKIAELAFKEHKALHQKHETILEKEYMRAVQLAYAYQRDVEGDTHGATLNPFASKLAMMIEVLKISKVKNRKRFYDNLCARIEFDPAKIDMGNVGHHLDFSQFIIENMAFFEYATVDELLSAISAMEKVVASTGTGIAHSIETEIFHVSLEQPSMVDENGQIQATQPTIDPMRLKLLTASSMLLSCLWEARTYLRKQYGLKSKSQEGKAKVGTKDLNRAPVKAPFMNGDKFWEAVGSIMSSMESDESMMIQCRSFVELLSVDQEFKIAAEADEDAEQRPNTPSDDEENGETGTPNAPGSGRGRKRKGSDTPGGRKKRARSTSVGASGRGRGRPKGLGKKPSVDRSDDDGGDW
jgi:cohesin loading factor subunit SCC2